MNFTPSDETLKRRDGTIGTSGFNERLKVDYKEGYRSFTRWFFIHEKEESQKFAKEKSSIVEHEVQNLRTSDGKMAFVSICNI